jgi:hypothetical protein
MGDSLRRQITGEVRLPRWPRPVLLIVILLLVAVIGASGLYAGYVLRSSTEQQIRLAASPVVATAQVEYQTQQLDPITGTVGSVASYQYVPPATQFSGPLVVTQQGVKVGELLVPGSLIASIDDVPVFALPMQVSMWRNLTLQDTGTDVEALNTALTALKLLRVRVTNVYSAATAAAVARLFKQSKFVAPSGTANPSGTAAVSESGSPSAAGSTAAPPAGMPGDVLPMSSVANMVIGSLAVTQSAGVGAVVAAGQPVVTAAGPVNTIVSKVDVLHKEKIKIGTVVSLQSVGGGDLGQGTITAIGDFSAGDSTKTGADQLNGYATTISFTPPAAGAATGAATQATPTTVHSGDQVQVQFPSLSDRQLAVPTIAVRQGVGAMKVIVKQGQKFRLVTVTPLWQQGGWTGIAAGSRLTDGETVVVSGK